MKTIRAGFWGSLVGIALGLLFAPRRTDLLRARAGRSPAQPRATTSAASTATPLPAGSVVGNRNTHIYHDATAPNLPSEENRVYFPDAAAAEAEGYRSSGRAVGAS